MGFRSLELESATKTMFALFELCDKVRCKWCKTNLEELVLITPKTKLSSSFNEQLLYSYKVSSFCN